MKQRSPPGRCVDCRHWSEDDDEDSRGACGILLNNPGTLWRTLPDILCLVAGGFEASALQTARDDSSPADQRHSPPGTAFR